MLTDVSGNALFLDHDEQSEQVHRDGAIRKAQVSINSDKLKGGKSSKESTVKHYMTPIEPNSHFIATTAKLFPPSLSSANSKKGNSSSSSVASFVSASTKNSLEKRSLGDARPISLRSRITKLVDETMAQHRKHGKQPFCGMIPSDRIIPTPTTPPSSTPGSSSAVVTQRGVSPARKQPQSLLNRPYENHDKKHQIPVFFPQNPLSSLSPGSSPSSQAFESVPNVDGTFDAVPMMMVMIPNQALMFALTHNNPTTVLPLRINSDEDPAHSTSQSSRDIDSILLRHGIDTISEDLPAINFAQLYNDEQLEEQIIDSYENEERTAVKCEDPNQNGSLILNHNLQLANNLLPQQHIDMSSVPSRLDRRQLSKRLLLLTTQEQEEQQRPQLQRINSNTVPSIDAQESSMLSNKWRTQSQRKNAPNQLQKAISVTARTAGASNTTDSVVAPTGAATNASRNKRVVWLSPRHYHQKHTSTTSSTATISSANRYAPKQNAHSPLDDEDQLSSIQHVVVEDQIETIGVLSDYDDNIKSDSNNYNYSEDAPVITNAYSTADSISIVKSSSEDDNINTENDNTSESSSNFTGRNHFNNLLPAFPPKTEVHADDLIDGKELEYEDDDGLFGFGKLLEAHSVVHRPGEFIPTYAQETSKGIFCLTSPVRTSSTLSVDAASLIINIDDGGLEDNKKHALQDDMELNRDGFLYPLPPKESRLQYFLHSAECIHDALERHCRYRQKHFIYELKRGVDRVNRHWQLLQRGIIFRKHYGVVPIFAKWLAYTRKRKQQRFCVLQKSTASSVLMTKLLVSSTQSISVYMEVNDMKKCLQRWRQWKERNCWCRKKANNVMATLATSSLKKAFYRWYQFKSNMRRSKPMKNSNHQINITTENQVPNIKIMADDKPDGIVTKNMFEKPPAAKVLIDKMENTACAFEGYDSEKFTKRKRETIPEKTRDEFIVTTQDASLLSGISTALSTENDASVGQQPLKESLYSSADLIGRLNTSKPKIDKEAYAVSSGLESVAVRDIPVIVSEDFLVTIIADLATSVENNGNDCKSLISKSLLPTLESDRYTMEVIAESTIAESAINNLWKSSSNKHVSSSDIPESFERENSTIGVSSTEEVPNDYYHSSKFAQCTDSFVADDPKLTSNKSISSEVNDDVLQTESSFEDANRLKVPLPNIEDNQMAFIRPPNDLSGQGKASFVKLQHHPSVFLTGNNDDEYDENNNDPHDYEQDIYDIENLPHRAFPYHNNDEKMENPTPPKQFEQKESSFQLNPNPFLSFQQQGPCIPAVHFHDNPETEEEGEEYYEDDFEDALYDQICVHDDVNNLSQPLGTDPQSETRHALTDSSLKFQHTAFPTESIQDGNDSSSSTQIEPNEKELILPTSTVYGARDVEEQDVVNHAYQDDDMDDLLPVYEGEDDIRQPTENASLFHPPLPVGQPSVTDSGNGMPPLPHSMTVSPGDTWEDSENSFLSGRGTPFAAFRDDLLPPLPPSPYDDEYRFMNDDENDPVPTYIDGKVDYIGNINSTDDEIPEDRWTPFHFIEAASRELLSQNVGPVEEQHAFLKEELQQNGIAASITDTRDFETSSSLPMCQSELATTVPESKGYRTISMQKAVVFHRRRQLSFAFYQLIQVLLKATIQQQVIHLISAPAAKRLAQQRALTRWFRSLYRYKVENQPIAGRNNVPAHSQLAQQCRIDHASKGSHHENRLFGEEDDNKDDENAIYQEYADDSDDVIRIIDLSEL